MVVRVNFRVSEETKTDLEKICNKEDINQTEFFKLAVRFFKDNPHILRKGRVEGVEDLVTKQDLNIFESRLFEKLSVQQRLTKEMFYFIVDQGKEIADQETNYRKILLDCPGLIHLDSYQKVEDYLIQQLPDQEKTIREDKVYNTAIFELMKEGLVEYQVRFKKLIWKVTKSV